MVEIKWTLLSKVRPEQNYVAFAGMGERRSAWSYFSFMMRARAVQGQLKTAKGIVGYTARLEFSSRKLVMVTVFEDEMALKAFERSGQHARCMEEKKPDLKGGMKFAKWSVSGSELPLKLDEAINRIQSK